MVGSPYWMAPEIIEIVQHPPRPVTSGVLVARFLSSQQESPHISIWHPWQHCFGLCKMTYSGFLLVRVRLCATFYFNALIVKLRCALNARVLLGHAWLQRAPPLSPSEAAGFPATPPSCLQPPVSMTSQQPSRHVSSLNGKDELQRTSRGASGSKSVSTEHINSAGVVAPTLNQQLRTARR